MSPSSPPSENGLREGSLTSECDAHHGLQAQGCISAVNDQLASGLGHLLRAVSHWKLCGVRMLQLSAMFAEGDVKTMAHYSCVTLTVRDTCLIMKIAKALRSSYFSDAVDMI
ncbi:hypothetical protein GX50_08852 [[Emmonsia] crescens]|uniref:Uncharacterized protein n=1 Tax=[Emmonsia] crescens TaxID=73230 RepID=A0A2B7Z5W4_9EURO|nr:hypothetical protein GX50_08852 [Emmonsia crescens]